MTQAFVIVLREGFEAFLIVAITLTYLRKTGRMGLIPAVYVGVGFSVLTSAILGYWLLQEVNQALWEGIFSVVAAVLVATLVIHMWRTAPRLKQIMHRQIDEIAARRTPRAAWLGMFAFTTVMITREGMETALMLMQVRGRYFWGALLGLGAAILMALLWARFGHLINLKLFFQVTSIFLLLFAGQILIYAFHELAEAGLWPNSEHLHEITEPYSPTGLYGRWFAFGIVLICAGWLAVAWGMDRLRRSGFNGRRLLRRNVFRDAS
ncbi:MAG: FTR1 family protein [Blastocatellia bacterium]|nr:FTR1 family protein [Blastocatellia bacterium]MCS7158270.1 FTR1 family protein [Blastocatellia bacterium]MCX7753108.1 FTR1 family protein [Blastocatellia bacterium]MDW8169422.1 FTR1 family protein [Acidobacteriota bacterium]MDW8255697.1 FTR1 family protein [Acidobacteriota bacterium]